MNGENPTVKFEAEVILSGRVTVWHFLSIPKSIVAPLKFTGNLRRVICSLKGCEPFQASLFPRKETYLLILSKKFRDKLGIQAGDTVSVEIRKDTSKYGMPMPEEFAEVLRQDAKGDRLFQALTPGNQRLMLKLIVAVKDVDKRIARGLAGIELLKREDGKFDYHAQHGVMNNSV